MLDSATMVRRYLGERNCKERMESLARLSVDRRSFAFAIPVLMANAFLAIASEDFADAWRIAEIAYAASITPYGTGE
jgi:hypothetical protein